MRPPISLQRAAEAVPAVAVGTAVAWLQQHGGDRVRPADKRGRVWVVQPVDAGGGPAGHTLRLTAEQVVARYRVKAGRIALGVGG